MKTPTRLILAVILIMACAFRIHGLDFDQGQHQHPDERFLTIVTSTIQLPSHMVEYFSPQSSPLNPYNHKFNFYVYGTFPLLVTRMFAQAAGSISYDDIVYIGRILSVMFDTATVFLVYLLARRVLRKDNRALWSAFVYAAAVLPIQQAHFFTVDSFLVFFSTATILSAVTFLQARTHRAAFAIMTGILFGTTLANKTSLAVTLPFFLFITMFLHTKFPPVKKEQVDFLLRGISYSLCFIAGGFAAFRILQPYAFDGLLTLSPHFISNISEAHRMITGEVDYPPNLQWVGTTPIIHPLAMIILWGLGPVASILTLGGIAVSAYKKSSRTIPAFLLLLFCAVVLVYQGVQHAKYMRYFYPLYPLLAVFAGSFCVSIIGYLKRHVRLHQKLSMALLAALILLWPVAFSSIYTREHPRIAASRWMFEHILTGSRITSEEWDDSLPLALSNYNLKQYTLLPLPMPHPETREKWDLINSRLAQADYLVLSSNRMYGSIPRAAARYPRTTQFYADLFEGKLDFVKVAEFSSYPTLFGVQIKDDSAEESFTVYDHPKVIIFKKARD